MINERTNINARIPRFPPSLDTVNKPRLYMNGSAMYRKNEVGKDLVMISVLICVDQHLDLFGGTCPVVGLDFLSVLTPL
jgi:hypothetical protein